MEVISTTKGSLFSATGKSHNEHKTRKEYDEKLKN